MTEASTEKVLEDLRTLVTDAEALLAATAGQVGDRIEHARGQAEASLGRARARLSSLEGAIESRVRESARATDAYVRDNPWRAVGIAAGVGLLVGLLVSSRR